MIPGEGDFSEVDRERGAWDGSGVNCCLRKLLLKAASLVLSLTSTMPTGGYWLPGSLTAVSGIIGKWRERAVGQSSTLSGSSQRCEPLS